MSQKFFGGNIIVPESSKDKGTFFGIAGNSEEIILYSRKP